MSESVKFIFKTLLRIPIIIMTVYLLFNIFAFSFTYFRVLGFSYVVMQTAVENNYLPTTEKNQLNNYLNNIVAQSDFVSNAYIVYNSTSRSDGVTEVDPNYNAAIASAETRRQYGEPVRVGVAFSYTFIWPLMPNEQVSDGKNAVNGLNGTDSSYVSDSELTARMNQKKKNATNPIVITYTVPGLKYYPDLLSY